MNKERIKWKLDLIEKLDYAELSIMYEMEFRYVWKLDPDHLYLIKEMRKELKKREEEIVLKELNKINERM